MSCAWPVCPRPQADESLLSWFERVGHEYNMSATVLLSSMDSHRADRSQWCARLQLERLHEQGFRERLAAMARLLHHAGEALRQPLDGWELETFASRVYCPFCLLQDLKSIRPVYGRRVWQQSWCTVCESHGVALKIRHGCRSILHHTWSRAELIEDADTLAADRYRAIKVSREPRLRYALLGCLLELERAVEAACAGVAPNPLIWGPLSAQDFLNVLRDVTTWSLTHFQPAHSWSTAEDLTPVEEQEGYGLLGRMRRMIASDYPAHRSVRTLQDVVNPKVRGSALWLAHALMSAIHSDASDRTTGLMPQERQAARLLHCAPEGREWLAERQQHWPRTYVRSWWIDPRMSAAAAA